MAQQANGQMTAQQLIDTVVQLRQAMEQSQAREQTLRQQLDQVLMGQQQQAQNVQAQLDQQAQTAQAQFRNDVGAAFQELAQSQRALMHAVTTKPEKKMTLVDTKGLAKPEKFTGEETGWLYWKTRMEAFITSVFPQMEPVLEWAEEVDTEVNQAAIRAAFGSVRPSHHEVEDVEEIDVQIYAILQTLCEKEPFQIVRSAGKSNGLEAWRKLNRRFDPSTGGRRGAMLRTILSPPKCQKIDNLWASVESWEEAVRQYEHRKRSDGTRHQLDDEIKVSILEQMCPVEIERHLQLNRSRYTDYNDVRSELVLYLETRLGQRLKIGDASGANLGDPMDVGGFEKGKGKDKKGVKGKGKNKGSYGGKGKGGKPTGKGKGSGKGSGSGNPSSGGKETRTCNNCGKPGHLRKDCWSAGGGAANKGQKPKGKSKGKGKGVNNLEEEPEAETAETGFLSIAGLEELDVKMEDDHEDVKLEHVSCAEPCDDCIYFQCSSNGATAHDRHRCNVCEENRLRATEAATKKNASKTSIRNELKWRPPESFRYILDKTICLTKGWTLGRFNGLTESRKDELRNKSDPDHQSRNSNSDNLKKINFMKEDLRVDYFERIGQMLLTGASRTFGSDPSPGRDEPSRASGSAELPPRPVGASSSTAMHRTIEMLEVTTLDAEKRRKFQEIEECEDEDERRALENRVKEIDERKELLKKQIRENDRQTKEKEKDKSFKLTEENVLNQDWHDARYYAAIKAGASHSAAWFQEKKRRRATLNRQKGTSDRAAERIRLDQEWHAEFDSKKVKEEEYEDETFGGMETEAVVEEEGKMRVLSGKAKQLKRGELKAEDAKSFVASKRSYRKLTQGEVEKFRVETKRDEVEVMKKPRVNIRWVRKRTMDERQKDQRRTRVKKARKLKRSQEEAFYLHHPRGERMCEAFRRSHCVRENKCSMLHSEVDREYYLVEQRHRQMEQSEKNVKLTEVKQINSFVADDNCVWNGEKWTKIVVNFDTGAAITAVPRTLAEEGLVQGDREASSTSYKTASGELLEDEGGVLVNGYDHQGRGRSIRGRLVNVHRTLASGTEVAKKNMVVLNGDGGKIIPRGSKIAMEMDKHLKRLMKQYPEEAEKLTEMYVQKGIYVFDLWVQNGSGGSSRDGDLGAVDFHRQAKL